MKNALASLSKDHVAQNSFMRLEFPPMVAKTTNQNQEREFDFRGAEQRQDLERSKTSNSYVYRNSVNSERGGRNVEDVNPLSYKRVGDDGNTTTFGTSCGINDPEYWAWGFR